MLSWNTNKTNERTIHMAALADSAEQEVRRAIENCADKAINLLENTVQDDSLYLLFEWDANISSLKVVVTDASKLHDSPEWVYCVFSGVDTMLAQDETQRVIYADTVKFWLHDYLTTCTAFFRYSLVAIFHGTTRQNTELL
jgi:hypothetical protein